MTWCWIVLLKPIYIRYVVSCGLKELDKRKIEQENIKDNQEFQEDIYDEELEKMVDLNDRYRLYQKHFTNLGKDCQKVLQLHFEKVSAQKYCPNYGV